MSGEFKGFADEELRAVLTLPAGPGVVWTSPLIPAQPPSPANGTLSRPTGEGQCGEGGTGSWVLLQPERINTCAQAVIWTLQADEFQRGRLIEERGLKGDLASESSMPRLAADEVRFVLLAMHLTLVESGFPSPEGERQ